MWAERGTIARRWRRRLHAAFAAGIVAASAVFVAIAPSVEAATQTFADDFATYGYAGSTGTQAWSGPWIDSEGDGPSSGGLIVDDTGFCSLDPCASIGQGGAAGLKLSRTADLSAAVTATFGYTYQIHRHDTGAGEIRVRVSDDGGGTWTVVRSYFLTADVGPTVESIDIIAFASATTSIQFELVGGNDDTHFDVDDVTITIDTNSAPVVDPVAPITADEETLIAFTATASDAQGDPFTFGLSGAPAGASIDPATGDFTWTPTEAQGPGVYSFDITATDPDPSVGSTTVSITVDEVMEQPTVDPIADRTDAEADVISFGVTASDPDIPADVLDYSASGLPPGITIDSGSGVISGTIDYSASSGSPYAVTVSVTDGSTAPVDVTFTWTVTNTNRAPVVTPIAPINADEETLIAFTAAAVEPDGEAFTFGLTGAPAGAAIDPATGDFTWTPTEAQGPGVYSFDVTATDPEPMTGSTTVTITVDEVNLAPTLPAVGDQTDAEGSVVSLVLTATDDDVPANTLVYGAVGLPPGLMIDAATGVVSGTVDFGAAPGSPYSVTVTVDDDGTPSLQDQVTFQWTTPNTNRPPVLDPIGDRAADEQTFLAFTATGSDPDLDGLSFSLGGGAPPGAAIDPVTGDFSWTPTEAQGPGAFTFDVTLTDDGTPALAATETITITVGEVNRAPSLTSPGDQAHLEGDMIAVAVAASDPDVPANGLTWTASGLPSGLSIDAATGAIGGTIGYDAAAGSPHTVVVNVSDDGIPVLTDQVSFTWTVGDVNRAPVLAPIADATVDEGAPLSITVVGSDPDGDGIGFSVEGAPSGLAIDPVTGTITWTPAESQDGTHTFDVVLTDDGAPSLQDRVTVTVTVGEVNVAPDLAVPSDRVDAEGDAISFGLVATDPDLPANTLRFSAVGLPPGLSVDRGTGFISGTISYDASAASPYSVTIEVRDGNGGKSSQSFAWTVIDTNRAPVVDAPGSIRIEAGTTVNFTASAIDPDGDAFTFGLDGPPAGATMDPESGSFTWSTTKNTAAGFYSITVVAVDVRSGVGKAVVTIQVVETNRPPQAGTITVQVDEDEAVEFAFPATDSDGDALTFEIVSGPDIGVLSGEGANRTYAPAADASGSDEVIFRVLDPFGASDEGVVSIVVRPVNDSPVAVGEHYTTRWTDELEVAAPGVLANDSDVDDVRLTATIVRGPDSGNVTLTPDGGFVFEPEPGFIGQVAFVYEARDAAGAVATAGVTIEVTAPPASSSSDRRTAVAAATGFERPSGPASGELDESAGATVKRTLVLMSRTTGVAVQQMGMPFLLFVVAAAAVIGLGRLRVIPLFGRRETGLGTVHLYSSEHGFGLVTPDGDVRELFMHRSALRLWDRERLEPGDRVRYRAVPGEYRDVITRLRKI